MYRDFRYLSLDTVSRHFLFDTLSIQARYVLGAVGTSILYRFSIPFRYTLDTSRILYEGCYAIENTVGSASQGYHTDYAHSQVGHLHGTPWYPRSAIWAALAAFEIGVRDGRVIRVPRDHVIFFMADFWHCGGPGLSPEPRFHGFQLASWTQIPTGVYT